VNLCVLCGVDEVYSRHHLIPKTVHSNKWFKKNFSREQMNETISICRQCHSMINTLDPKEIGRNFNTIEKLLEHPTLAKYIAWKKH